MAQPVRSVDRRFTTTAFEFPGYFIAQAHGVVRGITVRNPNAGKAFVGAFASLAGGESSTYIEMAEKARERAFLRMLEHAAAAGGNAVIGVEFTGQEIIQGMTEVMAYGTAVTLVPLQQQAPQQPIMQQPPQQTMYSPVSSPYGQLQHQQFSPALPPKN
ncbi:MAG: putative heavy-metal-binding-domain-containing protein [Linnemannia elongata]|nr:MAG: putative heavy-metal-binding-domain-containing protein [Linnemannia elongata]